MDKGHCWLHKELKRFSPSVAQFLSVPLSVYLSFILAPYNVLPYILSPVRSGQWLSIHLHTLRTYSQHVVGERLLGDILNCSGWLTSVSPSVSLRLEHWWKKHIPGAPEVGKCKAIKIMLLCVKVSLVSAEVWSRPLVFGKLPAITLLSSIDTDSSLTLGRFWLHN